jgi:hypothetical protein
VALIFLCGAQAASATTAEVTQSGSYTVTVIRQQGDHSRSTQREFNEAQYEYWKSAVEKRAALNLRRVSSEQYAQRCGLTTQAGNDVRFDQSGGANVAAAYQIGLNNSASISQYGDANVAYTVQGGQNFTANTAQTGTHNIALVIQTCAQVRPMAGQRQVRRVLRPSAR